ncbi:MAG: right-handed parallel beta-helix repeat-containing protein [Anaerolineales bacterium]|nr:right-handed parallel beta-helix repeat-containing protein [Anaerolineales bacterium]
MVNTIRSFTYGIVLLLMGYLLTQTVIWFSPGSVRADLDVFYVKPSPSGEADCSSWENACTLQTALAGVTSGDDIWIAAGVYTPGSTRTDTFTLKSGVALYGGFTGVESYRNERDWQNNLTILSGDIDSNDVNVDGNYIAETWNDVLGDNAYHVVTGGGVTEAAALDGFIITAGQANDSSSPNNRGGGMYNLSGSPTLTNVVFSGNSATNGYGGGIYQTTSSSPMLTNVTLTGNSATYAGGGIYNSNGSHPTLTNVNLNRNTVASGNGGGMYNYSNCNPILTDVTFEGNSAQSGGGFFNDVNSSPTLVNVVFTDNSATENGGGMFNWENSSATLTNSTFSGNSAAYGGGICNSSSAMELMNATFSGNSATVKGGGIYNYNSNPTLVNCILWEDSAPTAPEIYNDASTPIFSYSDIQDCGGSDSWVGNCGTDSGGNIDDDPDLADAVNDDLDILPGSPAIDAGTNTNCPGADIDGIVRPQDGDGDSNAICDMGAFEYDPTSPTVVSITRLDASPTNAATVRFQVIFSEPVSDVDTDDFSLTASGTISGAMITNMSGSSDTYTITVSAVSGAGALRLDVPGSATITDLAGNPLSDLPYTGGETYVICFRVYLPLVVENTP